MSLTRKHKRRMQTIRRGRRILVRRSERFVTRRRRSKRIPKRRRRKRILTRRRRRGRIPTRSGRRMWKTTNTRGFGDHHPE